MNKQLRERRVMQAFVAFVGAVILFSVIATPEKWFGNGNAVFSSVLLIAGIGGCAWYWFARKKT